MHTHTTHSDGMYTPEELVDAARREGYGAIVATDHDTVTANPEIKRCCDKYGMETLFGCEFTAFSSEHNEEFHLTAFDFDKDYREMKDYLWKCAETITNNTKTLFERGIAEGLIPDAISWKDVERDNEGVIWFCNNHVFQSYKKRGILNDLDYMNFFYTVYGPRRKEVPNLHAKLPIEELVPLIVRSGGIVFVAHPGHGKEKHHIHDVPSLLKYGITGIEVWHSNHDAEKIAATLKLAKKHNLYVSGGSDHSGLCGGMYSKYEDYTKSHHYIEPLSTGTTKEFFEEIKNRKLSQDRNDIIDEYLKEYV